MARNITFRTHLVGSLTEFCLDSKLTLFSSSLPLVELIVLLSGYEEEGVSLSPSVYITDDFTQIKSMLPDSESIKIGSSSLDAKGIKKAIKKCAPLADGGWTIYIQNNVNSIEYGLFKGTSNPIAVVIDEVMMTENLNINVVKVFEITNDCVEVKSNCGGLHYIFLNDRKDDSPPPMEHLTNLIESIVQEVEKTDMEQMKIFLGQLLYDGLRQSHGCIVAVTDQIIIPDFLSSDAIVLDEPIDFYKLVKDYKKKDIEAFVLASKAYLLKGMLNSDGIIVFNNRGQLLGYNCFVKIEDSDDSGGARKRAYRSVESKLSSGVCAVYVQSQDGWTEFKGITV